MNLSSTVKGIQDIMRKDAGVDGDAQRIGQLTWMCCSLRCLISGRRNGKAETLGGRPRTLPLTTLI